MEHSEGQKSQLPNTSLDDSPFLSVRTTRLRKKKTQSKLTFLKEVSKKNDTRKTSENENSCASDTKSEENPLETLSAESQCSGDVTSENISGNKEENISGKKEENINENKEENSGNKEESSVLACPVCWKHFGNSGDQMQHMKTCASKHNLTLKQLLDAVDLQTKQIEERKTLGLPCVPVTSNQPRKSTSKKSSVNDKNDPDLQLGLALSVSMRESEEQNDLREQEIMLEAGLGDEVAANQASLLERFGFTSTRPVLPSIYSRARPGKTKVKGTPLLLVRTSDERERLITEKVAIILTNEEIQHLPSHERGNEPSVKRHNLESETLAQIQNIECCLWQKASASPSPNDCDIYYVKCLSWVISPTTIKLGSKLKHLSQVPCRLKTPEKSLPSGVEDLNLNQMEQSSEIFHDCSQDILNRQKNEDESSSSVCNGRDNDEEITIPEPANMEIQRKSNEFVSKFIGDWSNMLNNCHMSDIRIYVLDGEDIYVHELVLFARCPAILKDVKQANNSLKYVVWSEISFECAFAFLYFIYCGSTCRIDELKNCMDEVFFLSLKYCVEDLCCYLKPVINERDFFEKYSYEDWNSIRPDVQSMVVKHNKSNWERQERGIFVRSPERNDYLLESCVSPDPFDDSCDQEETNASCTWKTSSLNTQQNIDNLIEALNVDEDEKSHQLPLEDSNKTNSEQLEIGEFIKELPDLEILEEMDDIHEASTIKKRKLSNCNSSSSKQMCTNERNSVRKSLLPSFSDEGENTLPNEKDEADVEILEEMDIHEASTIKKRKLSNCNSSSSKQICTNESNSVRKSLLPSFPDEGENTLPNEKDEAKTNWSQNIYKGNSVSSVESVGNVSVNSSISQRTEGIDDNSREVLEVVGSSNIQSPIKDELTMKSIPSISNEKLSGIRGMVADTSTDMLGDFCADYEYQNYYANYSPCSEKLSSHSKYDSEKSSKNAVSMKQSFLETHGTQDKAKSPISSPLSVKSLTRSSSNVSLNNDGYFSSPISIKCLSQDSIHLKSSNDICTETNKIQTASYAETDVFNPGTSSGMIMLSPVTPIHVHRTPNRSLNSVKRLLEDSFTAELEKNLLERKLDCESWPCSTPNSTQSKKSVFSKHLQNIKTGDNCITPMADYSGMDSPMLKRELQKYGLKPLKRKRAKQMLQHIYNELHPLVPVESNDGKSEFVRSTQDDVLPLSCTQKQSHEISTQKDYKKKSKLQSNDDRSESVRDTQDILPLPYTDKRSDEISTQKDRKKKSNMQSNDDRSEFARNIEDDILPLSHTGKRSDEISTQKDRKEKSKMPLNDGRSEFVRSTENVVLPLSCTRKRSDETSTQKDRKKKSKIQKGDHAIHSTAEAEIPSENEVSLPSSQESSSSSQCQFEVPEDSAEDGAQTQVDNTELPFIVHNYIMSNPELHQQVLLYEPIKLEQLHEDLKAQNYKFKLSQLMEYLDEKCITFRTNQGTKSKKRQKKSSK